MRQDVHMVVFTSMVVRVVGIVLFRRCIVYCDASVKAPALANGIV